MADNEMKRNAANPGSPADPPTASTAPPNPTAKRTTKTPMNRVLGGGLGSGSRTSSPPAALKANPLTKKKGNPPAESEIDLIDAQVRAAESEVEAARARAEQARMTVATAKTRNEILDQQLQAITAQAEAAQAQAQSAGAQRDAAKVQAEAAVMQVEAARAQNRNIETQVDMIRTQTDTLAEQTEYAKGIASVSRSLSETFQDQLNETRKLNGRTFWLAPLGALAALSLAVLAGLAVSVYLNAPGLSATGSADRRSSETEDTSEGPTKTGTEDPNKVNEMNEKLIADLREQQAQTNKTLAGLSAKLDTLGARFLTPQTKDTTTEVSVTTPELGEKAKLSWKSPALKGWLSSPKQAPTDDNPMATFEIKGKVKAPIYRDTKLAIDIYSKGWWPTGAMIPVPNNGQWAGTLVFDTKNPPSKLRITLWEGNRAYFREYLLNEEPVPPPEKATE